MACKLEAASCVTSRASSLYVYLWYIDKMVYFVFIIISGSGPVKGSRSKNSFPNNPRGHSFLSFASENRGDARSLSFIRLPVCGMQRRVLSSFRRKAIVLSAGRRFSGKILNFEIKIYKYNEFLSSK